VDETADTAKTEIGEAVAALKAGGLVILPTETVYGLAADAGDARAVARVYEAKGRPAFNPLIAHVADVFMARRIAVFDGRAEALAAAFWPGPLTLVLPVVDTAAICDLARAGLDTVAVRAPAHPIARALLQAFGGALVAPSANRSGRPSPTTFADALAETGATADVALDGGPCRIGLESTVVALIDAPRLLRPGAVTRAEIEALIGPLSEAEADAKRSPGRLTRHYAPNLPLRLNAEEPQAGEVWLGFGRSGAGSLNLSPDGDLAEAAAPERRPGRGHQRPPAPRRRLRRLKRRTDICLGEIIALVEQGRIELFGQRVGKAITKVQAGGVTAFAEMQVGRRCGTSQSNVVPQLNAEQGKPGVELTKGIEDAMTHQDDAGFHVIDRR
jgi:L-threonylcarbamoyladenylate synthase